MNSNTSKGTILVVLSMATAACGGAEWGEDEASGEAASAVEIDNALNPNALNPNALNPNALNPNALNPNALNPNALAPSALTALLDPAEAGALSRQLLKYAVSCALGPTQSFALAWIDLQGIVHNERYWGQLGLEPTWATMPLSPLGERWVSACLASRTNWYGATVMLSSRGPIQVLRKTDSSELQTYTHQEGVFWGNLFSGDQRLYSCDQVSNDAYSRASLRDCAAGHLENGQIYDCGPIRRVGSCDTACNGGMSAEGYRLQCRRSPTEGWWSELITVYLQ